MRTFYSLLVFSINLGLSMSDPDPDRNVVNAKHEEIASGWREKTPKAFEGMHINGEDRQRHRHENLKSAEQTPMPMLTTHLSTELLSKLTVLRNKINKTSESLLNALLRESRKKHYLLKNHPVVRGGKRRPSSQPLMNRYYKNRTKII